jgi:ligand-binding sensor domain-containing protein
VPSGTIYHLAEEADGTIWAAIATTGLARITRGKVQLFTTADGLPANSISALRLLANGELLIGTHNGLAAWREGKFIRNPTASWLDGASIAAIAEDRDRRLWVATNGQGIAVRKAA